MTPRSRKERFLALVRKYPSALGCLVATFGLCAYWSFGSSDLPEVEIQLDAKSAEARRLAANIKNAVRLREHTEAMEEALTRIDGRLVRASELATNLGYFYQLVKDSGVKLVDVRQNPLPVPKEKDRKPTGTYLAVPFSVIVTGDYPNLLAFLRSLENGRYFCRINNAILDASKPAQAPEGGEESAALRLTLSLDLEGVL